MLKNYHGTLHSTLSDNEALDEDENLLEELDDKQLVSRISNMEVQEQALKEKVKNNFTFSIELLILFPAWYIIYFVFNQNLDLKSEFSR